MNAARAGVRGALLLALGLSLALLAACDVPRPPVEQLTPVVGSATRTPVVDPNAPTPTPAPMTDPPTGHIWFVRGGRVWRAGPDGSGAMAVSTSTATEPPVPSPDGATVAFISDRKLIALDAAGGGERTLVEGDLSPRQRPAWSPDGKLIGYFTVNPQVAGEEAAWSIPAAGGAPSRLIALHGRGDWRGPSFERVVVWTNDQRRVAVSGPAGPIYIIPLDPSAGDAKTVNGGEPDWSTDNRTLLLAETLTGAIALNDVVTDDYQPYRNETRLDGTRLGDYAQAPYPRFNADASLILYRAQGSDGGPAVAVRARGGAEQLLVPGDNGAWAPDAEWIVYETGGVAPADGGQNWQPSGLARVRADGSGQANVLSDGQWPAWSK
jgi:hypothetical protein